MKITSLNELKDEMIENNFEEKMYLENSYIDKSIFRDDKSDIVLFNNIVPMGKMISIRKHTRYIHYPAHSHDYIELNYVLQGKCMQKIGERNIDLLEGDLLFLSPRIKHEIFPTTKDDIILNFVINPKFLNYIFEFIGDDTTLSYFLFDSVFKNFTPTALFFKTKVNDNIQKNISDIIVELNSNNDDFREGKIKFLIGLLVIELSKMSPDEISDTKYEKKLFYKIVSYIENNLKDANLNSVSKQLSLKNYNLSKLIKKESGQTFNEITKEIRLKKVCSLLASSSLPISELAEEIGFSNSSYFYKLFKETYGMSPKEYRQKMTLNTANLDILKKEVLR